LIVISVKVDEVLYLRVIEIATLFFLYYIISVTDFNEKNYAIPTGTVVSKAALPAEFIQQ